MDLTNEVNIGSGNGFVPAATCHYLSQCWPRSLSPYGVTRSQCVRKCWFDPRFLGLDSILYICIAAAGYPNEPHNWQLAGGSSTAAAAGVTLVSKCQLPLASASEPMSAFPRAGAPMCSQGAFIQEGWWVCKHTEWIWYGRVTTCSIFSKTFLYRTTAMVK